LLGVHEAPAFIDLHPLAFQAAERPVLLIGTERAGFDDEPRNGLFRCPGYADGTTFNQATAYLGALIGSEADHASIVHERLRMSRFLEK
jgi:hypothetical protein